MECPRCDRGVITHHRLDSFGNKDIWDSDCEHCGGTGKISDPLAEERAAAALERIAIALERIAPALEAIMNQYPERTPQ